MARDKSDEWNSDGLRDRLFGKKREIIVSNSLSSSSYDRNKIYVGVVELRLLEKRDDRPSYVTEDDLVERCPLHVSSKEPFSYPKNFILDKNCRLFEEAYFKGWHHKFYSLGEAGQRFTNINQIIEYIRKNNNGTIIQK